MNEHEPTPIYRPDIRFEHGDTNYAFAAYMLLAITAAIGSALVWVMWQIVKHLWSWPRS